MESTTAKSRPELTVVVPIYNEAQVISALYDRLTQSVAQLTSSYELIFINDGSQDESLIMLMRLAELDSRVYYISFSRNFGHQIAVTAGLDAAKGQAVVIIDGDLQDPPELIPELYAKYKEGYDVVYARRNKRKGESAFKKLTARWFYRLLRRLTKIDIPLDTGDFRIIDQKVVRYMRAMPEQNKFLRGQIAWLGFEAAEVRFDRDARTHGQTGYSLSSMLRFAMNGITGFSDKPLQLVVRLGLCLSIIAFLVLIYALYAHFILDRTITGWTSLIISITFLGGVQLLSIGVIGEYISRINRNVQNRPLYIVSDSNCQFDSERTGTAVENEHFDKPPTTKT
ncbi:MAG: glycosyltransferase family 2 protein [Bacteroidota bacterium]